MTGRGMVSMSKTEKVIRHAINLGYYVTNDGCVVSPSGVTRKQSISKSRNYKRKRVTIPFEGSSASISVHKLAAFQIFGQEAFGVGIQVRHLDGDSLNNSIENIALGTQSENMMDQPISTRVERSRNAYSYRKALINWDPIDADRANGMSYRDLEKKYCVSRSNFSRRYASV